MTLSYKAIQTPPNLPLLRGGSCQTTPLAKGRLFAILAILLALTSCGEWLNPEAPTATPSSIAMNRHKVTMLVGDTLRMDAAFTPADFPDQAVLWISNSEEVARFKSDTLIAETVGSCFVFVYSTVGLRADSCLVQVQKPWCYAVPERHDMVVNAAVNLPDAETYDYAAFADGTLVANGVWKEDKGQRYLQFRAWWPLLSDDEVPVTVSFRAHRRSPSMLSTAKETLPFDGETHGTLSNLFLLNF